MKIIERTHNIETGETIDIERDETAAEQAARETREAEFAAQQAETQAKATARQAVLDRLGLTAEEAQLLLGGN
jgi:hypothetical protein